MQKKKSTKFKTDDRIILLICIAGIIFSLFNYFADVYRVSQRTDSQPIARISSKVKSVQRRFRDRLVWDMLRTDSPLYVGDFVRTASYSEAVITFDSGTVLNMSQDSLIEIMPDTDNMNLKVASGTISIKAQKKMTLTAGAETLELEEGSVVAMNIAPADTASSAVIAVSETGATSAVSTQKISVSVQEGSIRQNKTDGTVVHVSAGSQLLVGADGTTSKEPAVIMISPLPVQKVIKNTGEQASAVFAWEACNFATGTKTRIELAYDKKFDYPYAKKDIADSEETSFTLPNRALYWRAYPVLSDGTVLAKSGAEGIITVYTAVPIKKLQPFAGTMYSSKAAQEGIRFSWTGDDLATSYTLSVSPNADMSSPVATHKTVDTFAVLSSLESGTWYWQVTPEYPDTIQLTQNQTEVASFTIKKADSLKPVKVIKPESDSVLYTAKGRQPILFSWQAVQAASSYTVKIADNPLLKKPAAEFSVTQTYISVTPSKIPLSEGKAWYWAVFYTNAEGITSPLSEIRTFYTTEDPPFYKAVSPADNISIKKNDIQQLIFNIDTNIPLASRFQLSRDKDFTEVIIDINVSINSFKLSSIPECGFYYWRVSSGSFTSKTFSFFVQPDENAESESNTETTNARFSGLEPQMVPIKGRTFTMGTNSGTSYEKPERTVTVDSFSISSSEVTQEQFERVMGFNPSSSVSSALPVEKVTWFEAVEFCNKLSMIANLQPAYDINGTEVTCNKDANGYRLPTEAEWECTAFASSSTMPKDGSGNGSVWTIVNSGNRTHGQDESSADSQGLYNLKGNVSEWCWDWFGYYRKTDTTNPEGASSGTQRAIRGGSWADNQVKASITYRQGQKPNERIAATGFRVVRSAN